jgi:hypothetical protein
MPGEYGVSLRYICQPVTSPNAILSNTYNPRRLGTKRHKRPNRTQITPRYQRLESIVRQHLARTIDRGADRTLKTCLAPGSRSQWACSKINATRYSRKM